MIPALELLACLISVMFVMSVLQYVLAKWDRKIRHDEEESE